jgi:formate dehydrogenase major subunit
MLEFNQIKGELHTDQFGDAKTMIKVNINGTDLEFEKQITILDAARQNGIEIPTLCHDSRLKSVGACRMCVVEINGGSHPAASCMTEIQDGMNVRTATPELEHARQVNLQMLAQTYPVEPVKEFSEKPFHALSTHYGLKSDDFAGFRDETLVDDSHPYIHVDMNQCIDCYRCVRICEDVQGQFVWTKLQRGHETIIVPDKGTTFGESSCVSCGACVDTCPTGALEDKTVLKFGAPANWTKTVCPYCGTGCEMEVGVTDDKIIQVKPDMNSPVNHGHLCVKGRYAHKFVDAGDRITEPMIRRNGEWTEVSWDEAISFAAGEMKRIVAEHGKESISVLGSARATNEENYVTQKFTRVCLETNNVDCCARVCHTPTAAAMKLMLGTGASTNSFDDIELAKTIIIFGANPTENHPIPAARIKQAVIKGTNLIVIDPRKTELTRYANIHLQLTPGTNILLFNALAHTIIEEKLFDPQFIAARVTEFEEYCQFVAKYSPESVAQRCGVPAELIRKAARMYATEAPAMSFHGLGITEHIQGTEGVMCIVNLALLTGNMGKRGSGVNPLRGQNNVQGSAHMGCDPGVLTGGIAVEEGREHFEKVWGAPVPSEKGLNQLQMMDAAFSGKLKAMWVIGYDVFLTNANAHKTRAGFENLELCIVQDMFLNETAKNFANVFFPVASSFEKDGTFMNAERRVSLLRKAIEPRGNSRTDWEIICDMAKSFGKGRHFNFGSSEEIWNEIRLVWPNAKGITYKRIEKHGLQWNCPDEDHPGTEILHTESFAKQVTAALRRIEFRPTKEIVSDDYPFLLTTGRALYHFNAGTMTERTPNLELRPSDLLEICHEDAARIGVVNNETVILRSKYGEAKLPVHVNDAMKTGELFCTFHMPQIFLNHITSPYRDRFVMAPEYKVTAVRIEKADQP